ncbi:MAG TPA: hypothetical protein VG944_16210 [Fimbriimonas sp.]|nr:hypothetical protein [Fimbriimonas sp.]
MSDLRDSYVAGRWFVLRRARPIDCARWRFLFEGAPPESVLEVLAQYQNCDGGFGHALEPDFWNPLSSPIQTWAATEIIHGLNYNNSNHPIVRGILSYLESGVDFDGRTWSRTLATNNDYPHAEWWSHEGGSGERSYNPTAALAGFALQFSEPGSALHQMALRISREAFATLLASRSVETHELSCFHRLVQCAHGLGADIGVDLSAVEKLIRTESNAAITQDTSTWATEYVVRPSRFIRSRSDPLFAENEGLVRYECDLLKETQLDDGSWPVTWHWSSFPDEWPIAREWWKSIIVIENVQFLREMESFHKTEDRS